MYSLWYGASFRLHCKLGYKVPRLRLMKSTLWSSLRRSEEAALKASCRCSTCVALGHILVSALPTGVLMFQGRTLT
jgi:hypothetical protein